MKVLPVFALVSVSFAQVADKANAAYKTPEGREQVAHTLVAPDRDAKQKPEELVQAMLLKPGMVVADIGTGAGYMLPFLSRAGARTAAWWRRTSKMTFWRKLAARPKARSWAI